MLSFVKGSSPRRPSPNSTDPSFQELQTLLNSLSDLSTFAPIFRHFVDSFISGSISISFSLCDHIIPFFSLYSPSNSTPPSILSDLGYFLTHLIYRVTEYATFFIEHRHFTHLWSVFPQFNTLEFFTILLHLDELPFDLSCYHKDPLDQQQSDYDHRALSQLPPYRTVVHFCLENDAVSKILSNWTDSDPELLLTINCISAFASYSITFDAFSRIRELLVAVFTTTINETLRCESLLAIGRFGSRSSAGIQWFLQIPAILNCYREPPMDDQQLLSVMLDILGNAGQNDQMFGICRSIEEFPADGSDVVLRFIERFLQSEEEVFVKKALWAVADCLQSFQIAEFLMERGLIKVVLEKLADESGFLIKVEAMRTLCIFFLFATGQMRIDFANSGFLDALFEWFEPMISVIGRELIEAVRIVFETGRDEPELSNWLDLTVTNDKLNEVLTDFAELLTAPMAAEVDALALIHEFDDWIRHSN
jgi:hypothetical protein